MKNVIFIITAIFFTALTVSAQTNWQTQETGVNKFFLDIYFSDASQGWICGQQGLVMRTTDGGETWEELDTPPSNAYTSVFFTDNQNGWVAGFDGDIIHTADGGETWESQSSNVATNLNGLFFMDENTGWIVGGDNGTFPSLIKQRLVLKTTNGGDSWEEEINESYQTLLSAVHFADYNNGWAVGESGVILHSSNGGETWEEQMSDNSYHFSSVYFANENKGWVTAKYLGLPHVATIFKTMDGGITWTSQDFSETYSLSDIWFTDESNGWAVGGNDGSALILHTTDGGETWEVEPVSLEQVLSSVHFYDSNHGWAAGYGGMLLKTGITTGYEEILSDQEIDLFPNPATTFLSINIKDATTKNYRITILNTAGQKVYESRVTGKNLSIPVADFQSGIYAVNIENSAGILTRKIVIR